MGDESKKLFEKPLTRSVSETEPLERKDILTAIELMKQQLVLINSNEINKAQLSLDQKILKTVNDSTNLP